MATRKQRKRRAKEHRHEYVWEDAEGNELEPEDVPAGKPEAKPARAGGGPRQAQQPSWERTLKRGAIFAPIMFVTVMLLSPDLPLVSKIVQTAIVVAIFIPFSYFLDVVFWRSYQRRLARHQSSPGRRGG
jgi:hypothetical protein